MGHNCGLQKKHELTSLIKNLEKKGSSFDNSDFYYKLIILKLAFKFVKLAKIKPTSQ